MKPRQTTHSSHNRSYIHVHVKKGTKEHVKALLDEWYRGHARQVFVERLAACYPRVERLGIAFPQLAVRVMRSRWGSCSPSGRITLNVKLIQMPTAHIDYVIYHELCHLAEPSHNARYYDLLGRALPDWRKRRQRRNEFEFG